MEKRLWDVGIKNDINYVPVSIILGDYSNNNLSKPDNIILFVGRLSPERGCDVLIKAIPFIKYKVKEFKVVVVGGGESKNEMKELAERLNVAKYIEFIDEIDPRGIHKVYDNVKVFVNPLKVPGIGNVTIEALSSGVPFLKSKIDCYFEYIIKNGENGYTFNVGDSKDLADRIVKVLKNDNWNSISKNARESVNNHDVKTINDEFENIILKYMV